MFGWGQRVHARDEFEQYIFAKSNSGKLCGHSVPQEVGREAQESWSTALWCRHVAYTQKCQSEDAAGGCVNEFEATSEVKYDSFPLAIFTLENAKQLFVKNSVHESIFLLWFALFHAFFRGVCSLGTRLRMGLCFLHFSNLYTNYFNTTVKEHMCMCGEYRRRGGGCVTAFPVKHIERMTVTVSTVMGMILTATKGDEIALNRFSTHPLESFFGQLRVLCRFKHSYDNILKKAAQTVVIKQGKRDLGISDWIAKRVNVAGQRVVIPMNDISVNESEIVKLCQSIMFFVDSLYVTEFLGNVSSEDEHKERVLSFLEDISYVTLPHVNLIGDYSGQQILTRLICNSRAASQEQSDQSAQLGEKQVSSPV